MGKGAGSVSVIVLTYNADWDKLRLTLNSVLKQEGVEFEIIIADDGSKTRHNDKICALFEEYGFKNYKFSDNAENVGTCKNLFAALELVTADYVKAISPGDAFYNSNSLYGWTDFMSESGCDASFCNAVYYADVDGEIKIIEVHAAPKYPELYKKGSRKSLFVDYLLANDTVLGASLMMKTEVIRRYMSLLVDNVKYAEDYMLRLAVFEGRDIRNFPQNCIFYEYGLGISTAKSQKWAELLHRDFVATDRLIAEHCTAPDSVAKRYAKYLSSAKTGKLNKIYKCLMFPSLVYFRIKPRFAAAKTSLQADLGFLKEIMQDK